MKNLVLALIALTLSDSARAGEAGFTCVSHWYREAELSVNHGSITVKDSYVNGQQEIAKMVEEQMNLGEGKFLAQTVAIGLSRDKSLDCRSQGLLVSCRGRAAKAHLQVKGWVISEGMSGDLNLWIPVELKNFDLQSSLGASGPISVGSEGATSVQLGRLNLEANAKVLFRGREVDLNWNTFFNPRDEKASGSYCARF